MNRLNIRFASAEHRDFFLRMMSEARKNDCYRGTLHKEGAPGRLLYHSFISSRKRCNPCGYAVFSLLRSVRCCWKASSISSGVSSWRMPTPL